MSAGAAASGCGSRTVYGHGDTAICGEPYYSGIYICKACELISLRADLIAARALLAEVLNMHESSEIYTTSWDMTVDTDEFIALTKRIDALLKGAA